MSRPNEPWRLPVADHTTVRRACLALVKADLRSMTVVVLLAGLAAASGLAGPWLLGRIVTRVEEGNATTSSIDQLTLGVILCAAAQLVLTRFALNHSHRFGERALARLREETVDTSLALPARVVEQAGTGDLITRTSLDVSTVATTLRSAVPDVFTASMQLLFIFAAVFVLHPLLGLWALCGMPMLCWVTRWYLTRARAAYLAEGEAASELAEIVAATAEGARTVEAFGLRGRRILDADRAVGRAYGAARRTLFLRTVLFPVAEFAHSLPVAVTLLAGGYAYLDGSIALGVVVTGSLYMRQLADPLDRVLMWMEQLQRSGASFARIKGIGMVAVERETNLPTPVDDRIDVRGVHYSYVAGHDVLKDVNLTVRPGERLALVGPSGAGKTTLGKLLSGADAPRTGSIVVGGVPVAGLACADALGNRIVLVTQEHHVFMGSLRENLTMAAPEADDDRLLDALAVVGADWVKDLSDGLDTPVGSGGATLDPARSQQLSLARVELADPHTLILDEATSLLDPTTARHAERAIAAVRADRTVIAIAHRLQTAHDADRIAVVEDGRIVELGSHDELVAAEGAYAALWRSWHGKGATEDAGRVGFSGPVPPFA